MRKLQLPTKARALVLALLGLSVVAVPAVAEAATTSTTVSSQISSVLSLLTSDGTVNIDALPTSGGVQTIASDTVTVSTNDTSGYTLKLAETGGTSTLTSGSNTIPAVSGTQASPVVETANHWGYRVDGVGGFGTGPTTAASNATISGTIKFAPVPATASPDTIKTTSSSASNDTTTVWYGVAVNLSAVSGTYTNSVTYTAVAN